MMIKTLMPYNNECEDSDYDIENVWNYGSNDAENGNHKDNKIALIEKDGKRRDAK